MVVSDSSGNCERQRCACNRGVDWRKEFIRKQTLWRGVTPLDFTELEEQRLPRRVTAVQHLKLQPYLVEFNRNRKKYHITTFQVEQCACR